MIETMKKKKESLTARKKAKKTAGAVENVANVHVRTAVVTLTQGELIHLRDLFGVLLPPAASQTLSQALAHRVGRPMLEAKLWRKLLAACSELGVPVGDGAPDFAVAVDVAPSIGVFKIEHSEATEHAAELETGDGGLSAAFAGSGGAK
jgi:hypothetical protein